MPVILSQADEILPTKYKRMHWLKPCLEGLKFLCGDDVLDVKATLSISTDPLCCQIMIPLKRPLQKNSREPCRWYLRYWAISANCEVPAITIDKQRIYAKVFTKTRYEIKEMN